MALIDFFFSYMYFLHVVYFKYWCKIEIKISDRNIGIEKTWIGASIVVFRCSSFKQKVYFRTMDSSSSCDTLGRDLEKQGVVDEEEERWRWWGFLTDIPLGSTSLFHHCTASTCLHPYKAMPYVKDHGFREILIEQAKHRMAWRREGETLSVWKGENGRGAVGGLGWWW